MTKQEFTDLFNQVHQSTFDEYAQSGHAQETISKMESEDIKDPAIIALNESYYLNGLFMKKFL